MTLTGIPLSEETTDAIRAGLAERGLELCHVAWVPGRSRGRLTLTIDRQGGVTLDDCEAASRAASQLLDRVDGPKGAYVLEVESPGLDRPLYSLADCQRFRGRRVRVQLNAPVEGTSRVKGTLESVKGSLLTVLDEDRGRHYTVEFGDVRVARLIPEL